MPRIALLLVVLLVGIGLAVVLATASALPATVATHYGAGGRADGFMTRADYQLFIGALIVLVPLVVYAAFAWLPASFPSLVNIPNRAHWLAEPRRAASIDAMRLFGVALAAALVALFVAMHFLLIEAHSRTPAALDERTFFVLIGGFLAVVLALVALLYARFRSPG